MSNLAKLATAVQDRCARIARDFAGVMGPTIADSIQSEDLTYLVAAHVGQAVPAAWIGQDRLDQLLLGHAVTTTLTPWNAMGDDVALYSTQPVIARSPSEDAFALLRIFQTWLGASREQCDEGGKRLWDRISTALATTPAPTEPKELTPLNEHTRFILGRPNFSMIGIANMLRQRGDQIAPKAEDEQAHAIHFLLNMYEQHGANWNEAACAELRRIDSAPKPEGGV